MTNNPTIDGVSRNALEQALLAMKRIYQAGYDRILEAGGQFDTPEYMMAGDPTARELRALLDAPAVEQQEPVDALSKGFYTTQSGNGNYSINIGFSTLNEMQAADKQMLDVLRNRSELAALQSRIDQLEATYQAARARIEELESGRGEPVAWMYINRDGYAYRCTKIVPDSFPVYRSPTAPVSVVLPDRIEPPSDYAYRKGWNACLDATAALNGSKS